MNKMKILLVDDQISSLIVLEQILEDLNAILLKATSAQEALRILMKDNIDCILLDVCMPDMDGFEFLKTLHNAPTHSNIPVIMVTGKIFSDNETLRGYQYGAVDFLLKPLDSSVVRRKVGFFIQQAIRIRRIESLEGQLSALESDIISPVETMLNNELTTSSCQTNLTQILVKLKNLNQLWEEINHAR